VVGARPSRVHGRLLRLDAKPPFTVFLSEAFEQIKINSMYYRKGIAVGRIRVGLVQKEEHKKRVNRIKQAE
jgi:hypothetical protein